MFLVTWLSFWANVTQYVFIIFSIIYNKVYWFYPMSELCIA